MARCEDEEAEEAECRRDEEVELRAAEEAKSDDMTFPWESVSWIATPLNTTKRTHHRETSIPFYTSKREEAGSRPYSSYTQKGC